MKGNNVVSFFSNLINKVEPEYTWRLVDIIYSKKHGHEICVMHLAGKSAFPKFTTEELLSDPHAMKGISALDAVSITKLDHIIKERKKKSIVLEIDKNGTILLRDSAGNEHRYAEKFVSSNREMIYDLQSQDAHDLGYRVGFRDGINVKNLKKQISSNIKNKILKYIKLV
ncbi:MAG: hypothetical protein H0T84_12000 [Tatlockia sp.]|nr:hypothetical protein [Tatlockia sp.]